MRRRVSIARPADGPVFVREVPVEDPRRLVTYRVPPFPDITFGKGRHQDAIVRVIPNAGTEPDVLADFVRAIRGEKPARITVLPIPQNDAVPEAVIRRADRARSPRRVVESVLLGMSERGAPQDLRDLCVRIMDEEGL
jgi:hypothetical protein